MLQLVEEASVLYQRITHPQDTEEHKNYDDDSDIMHVESTTNTTLDNDNSPDSANSCSDDETDSVPKSRNGTGTQQTGSRNGTGTQQTGSNVTDTPWKIFFPKQTGKNDDVTVNPTNQITDDITSKTTNHRTVESITGSIQGNKHHTNDLQTSDNRHSNACVLTGQQVSDYSSSNNHINDIIDKDNDITPKVSFHWNVNAAEFIPS